MSDTPNKVVVDLEGLGLKDHEVARIGAAVQNTVLKELGGLGGGGSARANLGVLTGFRDPKWIGLIIRDLSAFDVKAAKIDEIRDSIR